jgi:hypothetical protein
LVYSRDHHFAPQQSPGPNVRFGSKADIAARPVNVCFTPESGHSLIAPGCPLCAKSRHGTVSLDHVVGEQLHLIGS